MERCEKVAFQLIKIRKMNISRNIKIEYVTDIFVSVGSSRMKFILFNRGGHIKVNRIPQFNKNNEKMQMIDINLVMITGISNWNL